MRRTSPDRPYGAYILGMDDTIYLGDDLLFGAKRFIEGLHGLGRPVCFLSNNPMKGPQLYLKKLGKLGTLTPIEEVTNTAITTVRWLKMNHPDAVVLSTSEEPLKKALAEVGIAMSEDPERIDIVITFYDRTSGYRELQIASDVIWLHRRASLTMTNLDCYCLFPSGRDGPDAATIVAATEACTETEYQVNMGKPGATMLSAAIDGLDVDPASCMMMGDRPMTGTGMAIKMNMVPCLLLAGGSVLKETEALDPADQLTFVLNRIDYPTPETVHLEWGWSDADE